MGSIAGGDGRPHLLVLPHTSAGHISATLRVAKEIAERGFIITFVSYEAQISRFKSTDVSSQVGHLDFRFVAIRDLRATPEEAHIPYLAAESFRKAFKPMGEQLIREKKAGAGSFTAVLSDMFFSWSQDIADELQIPRYLFVTSGAVLARFQLGSLKLLEEGEIWLSERDDKLVMAHETLCIPGLPPLKYQDLTLSCRKNPSEFVVRCRNMLRAAGIIVNSSYAVEGQIIDSYEKAGPPDHPPIFPVGPLLLTGADHANFHDMGLTDGVVKVLSWLDAQPSDSVVYVAFGSLALLSPVQLEEMAHGLEASGQRFFWAVPLSRVAEEGSSEDSTQNSLTAVLPEGFEARVGDRGRIVAGWVPQMEILARPAIGAFLTHAGWNSILEGMTFGKPFITWPREAEQHLNARFLVDSLKVADEIRVGPKDVLERKEVERAVRVLILESEGKGMRSRVKEIQSKIAEELPENGPRTKVVDDFARHLKTFCSTAKAG